MRYPVPDTVLLTTFLDEAAAEAPDRIALEEGDRKMTFRQVQTNARQLAGTLVAEGILPGDRVFLVMENCTAFVVAYWAIQYARAVVVPITPQTPAGQLAWLIDDAQPRIIIADRHSDVLITDALAGASVIPSLIWSSAGDFEQYVASWLPMPVPSADELAAIIYTSGSTSNPKGVMLSHLNLVTAACSVCSYLEYEATDRIFCVIPFTFDYGMHQITMSALAKATLIIERSFAQPLLSLHRMALAKATVFPIVPTVASLVTPFAGRFDLSGIRIITSTAAAFNVEAIDAVRAMVPSARVFSMYGLTECHRCTYLDPTQLDVRKASIGKAIPLTSMWVEDEEGNRAHADATGELVIRGDTVMLGYWKNPAATNERLFAGDHPGERYLHTGDIVRLDEEGFAYFVGRRDEMLKVRGQKVAPVEVERTIAQHAGVAQCAVIGVPDEVTDTRLIVFVELQAGQAQDLQSLERHFAQNLKPHQRPAEVRFVASLPKSPNGKIDKKSLKATAGLHVRTETLA